MQSIVLTIHLILAVLLIGVVLLQRSEGGGLGMGGGGGGVMTGRQAANALTRATWIMAAAFIITSIALTIIAARGTGGGSVLDRFGDTDTAPASAPSNLPAVPRYEVPPGVGQPIAPPQPTATTPTTSTPAGQTPTAAPTAPADAPSAPSAPTSAEPTATPAATGTAPASTPADAPATAPVTAPVTN